MIENLASISQRLATIPYAVRAPSPDISTGHDCASAMVREAGRDQKISGPSCRGEKFHW